MRRESIWSWTSGFDEVLLLEDTVGINDVVLMNLLQIDASGKQ